MMRLDQLDLPLPVEIETTRATDNPGTLDPRTRQALIKLLGRAIALVGEAETRAIAPVLVAYLAGTAYDGDRPEPAGIEVEQQHRPR